MPIDLSKEQDDDLLPDGVYKLKAKVIYGGYGDDDVLKLAKRGTLAYVNLVNTVIAGPYAGTEIWDTINVLHIEETEATETPEQVAKDKKTAKIGRLRAKDLVASARAINPEKTDAEGLKQALTINGWGDLSGLVYWAMVGTEEAKGNFAAKNKIERIITPAVTEWPGSASQPAVPTRPVSKPDGKASSNKSWKDEMSDEIPF